VDKGTRIINEKEIYKSAFFKARHRKGNKNEVQQITIRISNENGQHNPYEILPYLFHILCNPAFKKSLDRFFDQVAIRLQGRNFILKAEAPFPANPPD